MKRLTVLSIMVVLTTVFFGCLEAPETNTVTDESESSIENAIIPSDFNYSTQTSITIKLSVPEFLKKAVVSLYTYQSNADSMRFARVSFDDTGLFQAQYCIPAYIDSIMVLSEYLGLINKVVLPISGKMATFDYRPFYTNDDSKSAIINPNQLKSATANGFTYMGNYDSNGVPTYLASSDEIQQNLLDDVNASLPEYSRVPENNPEYLEDGKRASIVLTKDADVWVTYVAEGAGWRNALGYYSYEIGNAPKTVDDINELKIIFPNVSQRGSGGGLVPGNKVHLGQFPANTIVSWFLVADGWRNGEVQNGNGIHFSQFQLNSESEESLKPHIVMLYDKTRELLLLSFEDVPRHWSMCDDDFNDAVFYATVNPISAVKTDRVTEITAANDSDNDGINDEIDDFPYDPDKSFNNYLPSAQSNGTLAFEDLWPSTGDYDFNDCVISYNFNLIANAQNKVSAIEAKLKVEHIGASLQNGFAFEIPIDASIIKSIDGQILNVGFSELNTNGTESGVNNSVIIAAENLSKLEGETITLNITLAEALSKSSLGDVPFNPFLIINGERAREVHLPDFKPTSKGTLYLGNDDDYSDPSKDRYYKTNRNLPWALNIYDEFSWANEKVSIDKKYPKFISWANSGGTIDKEWYK